MGGTERDDRSGTGTGNRVDGGADGAEHHRRQQDSHNWTCESTEPHENTHDQQRPEAKRDSDGETAAVTASRTKPEEEKE